MFVSLDGKAPPLADWVAPAQHHVGPHDFSAFRLSNIMRFEFAANWKLAVENYTDTYHVFSIHPDLHDLMTKRDRFAMNNVVLGSQRVGQRMGAAEHGILDRHAGTTGSQLHVGTRFKILWIP